jgi:DcaP outer membrane protein
MHRVSAYVHPSHSFLISVSMLRLCEKTRTCLRNACPIVFLCTVFLVAGLRSAHAQGQDATSAQIEALQKKLDTLQSQMTEVQGELKQLSVPGKAPAAPTVPATRVNPENITETKVGAESQQDTTAQAEAELTPKKVEIGKSTSDYRTYAQDPQAAPRINNEPLDPRFPGYFRLPGTNNLLRIGGYAKTDFIYDLKPAGNVDSFIPATIPIPAPAEFTNSTISVRPTRMSLDFLVPTSSGSLRFYIEADLFGSNATTPRLRHAYGQAKNFLIGQSFSNFMDPDAGPDQLDFQGPNAQVSIRNPQFRFSTLVAERTTFSLSAEKPTSDVAFTTPDFSAQPNSPAPDGTFKLRREMERGHVQFSVLLRDVAAFAPNNRHDSVLGWGFNLAGSERLFGKDTLVYEGTYGQGIERYINDTSGLGIDAAIISAQNTKLTAVPVVATYGGFQHFWVPRLRSNAVYGFLQVQNTAFQPGPTFHESNYMAGNLIWNPYHSLTVGTEFLYGWRVNKNNATGNAPRIMFSAKYNFIRAQSE